MFNSLSNRFYGVPMKKLVLLMFGIFALSGCAASVSSLTSATSSEIGCHPDEISVSNYKLNAYTSSWTADCNGKTYYCSGLDTLKDRVSCKKAQK